MCVAVLLSFWGLLGTFSEKQESESDGELFAGNATRTQRERATTRTSRGGLNPSEAELGLDGSLLSAIGTEDVDELCTCVAFSASLATAIAAVRWMFVSQLRRLQSAARFSESADADSAPQPTPARQEPSFAGTLSSSRRIERFKERVENVWGVERAGGSAGSHEGRGDVFSEEPRSDVEGFGKVLVSRTVRENESRETREAGKRCLLRPAQ